MDGQRLLDATGAAAHGLDAPIIRIHPERIISFGLDDKELDVHQLVVNGRDVGRRESN